MPSKALSLVCEEGKIPLPVRGVELGVPEWSVLLQPPGSLHLPAARRRDQAGMAAGAGGAASGEARHVALKVCRQLVCKDGLGSSCRDLLWSWLALGRGCGAARLPPVMLSPPLCRVGGCKAV